MKNPYAPSTQVRKKYAEIQDGKEYKKIYITKAEEDMIFEARKMKETWVLIRGREYQVRNVRMGKVTDEDLTRMASEHKGPIEWTEHGPYGNKMINKKREIVWKFIRYRNPEAPKKIEEFLGYFHEESGQVIRIK